MQYHGSGHRTTAQLPNPQVESLVRALHSGGCSIGVAGCRITASGIGGIGSVEELLDTELRHDQDALVARAVRANVQSSVHQLRHGSEIIDMLPQGRGMPLPR